MPNNCSTLIQRKQNILHKILRSNSEGKIQNAVNETTAALCVAGTRKTPAYSPTSTSNLITASAARRSNAFANNRIQPTSNHLYETHFPSIRDASENSERQIQSHDELHYHPQSKKISTNASPKSNGHAPSTSISSIFNALTKRSTENFMSTYGDFEDTINPSAVPPASRRSQHSHKTNEINHNTMKQTVLSQKQSGDATGDIHLSSSTLDKNQQRTLGTSARVRTNMPQIHVEASFIQEATTRERANTGQIYQRRITHNVKAPIKQKIDKYRRRSGENSQAANGSTPNGLSPTSPSFTTSPFARPKQPPSSPAAVHRVSSDAEVEARLEVLRLSMDNNFIQADKQTQSQPTPQQPIHPRIKSPYFSNNNHHQQQITPKLSTSNPPTPPVRLRRTNGTTQPISSASSSRHVKQQQQSHLVKQSKKSGSGNLYLAFISSRHFSALDENLFDCDIDHEKLLNIFTWLKGVEEHRHEQLDHEFLLNEQYQRMLDVEENLSLYSEIQFAVDDIPANTTGKPCERIEKMQFGD
ncbi:unnamed protein product [Rotaria magnacalcarata]|uniref:Uncharacterized protein n=5 Tax=Rotaria magnacalcarata TaxID=392030 RepID=A0A816QNQ0_9BILA|nr:unnamed protein product [Rotaria magnacalcarata]CAF2063464.1 unnamed protein product [Rotaria magnacalcarata]